jgi:glycosyltransferase involved in cell wall biosynthesis
MDFQIENFKQRFKTNKCCVIVPTYNNATTLQSVIEGLFPYTDDIVIINDGSTDGTGEILNTYTSLRIIHQPVNRGKGFALRTAFDKASQWGYENAITIDSDGQHNPADIPKFLDKMEQVPGSIIIGARNMEQASVPGKSSFGHKFSNFWFWFETGLHAPDTQSGFRLYPLKLLQGMIWYTKKYEFEIEVIVRAAWRGIGITAVPVSVYYAPEEIRISHFRPFKDFSRVSVLNVVLVTLALLYYKPLRIIQLFKKKNLRELIKINLLNPEESDWKKTFSVMFGVFMGIFPVWGYQLLIGISLAHVLRLNKVLFVLAAHISIPPMIPVIIFFSYHLGGFILGNPESSSPFTKNFSLETIQHNMYQYIFGSIALAMLASLLFGILTFLILKLFPLKKKETYLLHY